MTATIFKDQEALARLCDAYDVARLSLFGSRLKGVARDDSDVDLLVEFKPDARPNLLRIAELELALSPLVDGRRVDLRTAADLSRHFREDVVSTAALQYAA
jgi:uncharacterized protein